MLAPPAEGRLGAPAAYVLPTHRHPDVHEHPLAPLAVRSRARADAHGFDVLAALARDATRFEHRPGPAWGLAADRLPEVLVVARIAQGDLRPFDRFVAIPRYPWSTSRAVELLLTGTGPIANQEVVTWYGEVVGADLLGVIVTRFVRRAPRDAGGLDPAGGSDWATLKSQLAPRRAVRTAAPELFTWSSAFNSARDFWPGVDGLDQLACLTPAQTREVADHFLGYGLEALAAESDHLAIRAAAGRLLDLCDGGQIDVHLTDRPYEALRDLTPGTPDTPGRLLPEEHGLAYVPARTAGTAAGQAADRRGTLLVPLQWVAAALQREIVALVHLVRVASLARDDSYGKLTGTVWGHVAALHTTYAMPQFDTAVARADGLADRFLAEALRFDNRVYGLQVRRDGYCRAIEQRSHQTAWYPDPRPRR